MINFQPPELTEDIRRSVLRRSLNAQPFFEQLDFHIDELQAGEFTYSSAHGSVNKDFWITEFRTNSGAYWRSGVAGINVDLALYIANRGKGVLNWIAKDKLPSFLQCGQYRQNPVANVANLAGVSRQRELMPIFIKANDVISGDLKATVGRTKPGALEAFIQVVLAGYYTNPNTNYHLPQSVYDSCEDSLKQKPIYNVWHCATVDEVNPIRKSVVINNDKYPKLVLGFGRTNYTSVTAATHKTNTVLITDIYRGIKLMNEGIDPAALAAGNIAVSNYLPDSHLYYLPIEHFWQPLSPLKFDIVNDGSTSNYDLFMLTRTI